MIDTIGPFSLYDEITFLMSAGDINASVAVQIPSLQGKYVNAMQFLLSPGILKYPRYSAYVESASRFISLGEYTYQNLIIFPNSLYFLDSSPTLYLLARWESQLGGSGTMYGSFNMFYDDRPGKKLLSV